VPIVQQCLDLVLDFKMILHCSNHEHGTLGIDYSQKEYLHELQEQAEAMSNDPTEVIVKRRKIMDSRKPIIQRVLRAAVPA